MVWCRPMRRWPQLRCRNQFLRKQDVRRISGGRHAAGSGTLLAATTAPAQSFVFCFASSEFTHGFPVSASCRDLQAKCSRNQDSIGIFVRGRLARFCSDSGGVGALSSIRRCERILFGHSNCVILRDSCKLSDLHFPSNAQSSAYSNPVSFRRRCQDRFFVSRNSSGPLEGQSNTLADADAKTH